MKILMMTAPFETENTGDIAHARQMERCLRSIGHDIKYLRAEELGLAIEVSKALDTSIKLCEVYGALKTIGDLLVEYIFVTAPKDTVLFLYFRIPHTGFSFSEEHLSQLKSAGYKICALINEHACNRNEPTEIERNYQTAKLIPFFDQMITFNPIDMAGLLQTASTRNFYHCIDQKLSLAEHPVWALFQVSDRYPARHSLQERLSLIPAPILSSQRYEAGPEDRPQHILMFGTIRRNKGNTTTLNLARLLAETAVPNMQIKIVGRVLADMNGFCSFKQYVLSTFPETLGFSIDFLSLERALAEKDSIIAESLSLDDYEVAFNHLCKALVEALESQVTENRRKALPIEFHIDVNDETFKSLCHQSRFGIKFDKKGFCDNASTIINMMGLGLIVISNKTRMTNPIFTQCAQEELPLVLLDTIEPEAAILLQIILRLTEDTPARQLILKNLERVMTTLFDPMRITFQVADVLKKTLNLETLEHHDRVITEHFDPPSPSPSPSTQGHLIPRIEWIAGEKAQEWRFAKENLIHAGALRPDGYKIRRKDCRDILNHSFMVIDQKIIALPGKGIYLGEGINGHVKLAEEENGHLIALKVITNERDGANSAEESQVSQDLRIAGQRVTRTSSSRRHPLKHYIAYQFLGIRLFEYLAKHRASLDLRYEIGIKIALALDEIHTGKKSQSNRPYIHGDIHGKNIVVDEKGNPHFIDYGRAKLSALTHEDSWKNDIVQMLHVFFTPFTDRIRWYTDWIYGDWIGEYQFVFYAPPEVPSKQTIYIYLNPEDVDEHDVCLSIHYAVFDRFGTFQNKIISLHDLGLPPVFFEHFKEKERVFKSINSEIKTMLEKKIRDITDSLDYTTSIKNRNNVLFDLLKNPTDFFHIRHAPTALDVAEILTLCRYKLEKYQRIFIRLPADERLEIIHILNSGNMFLHTDVAHNKTKSRSVGHNLVVPNGIKSMANNYSFFNRKRFIRNKHLSAIEQENHFSESVLDVINDDFNSKVEISKAAYRLREAVVTPILDKLEIGTTLKAEEAQSLDYLIGEHSLDDPQWDGIMHDYSSSEIKDNIELQKTLLRRFSAMMDPEQITANVDVRNLCKTIKMITDCSFCYVEKLAQTKEGHNQEQFGSLCEWIMPTKLEIEMRVRRTPEHLAMTHGIGTVVGTDIAPRSTIHARAYRAGKAAFSAANIYQRARLVVDKYDAAVAAIRLKECLPMSSKAIRELAEETKEVKELEKKMAFYNIPLTSAERPTDFLRRVPIPGIQHLSIFGANVTDGGSLPLIAGASATTARTLIALYDLGFFYNPLGIFQSRSAGYLATALCGAIVRCGHHSVLEVGEIYNRLIDYEAVRYVESIAIGENTGLREECMPYYHIGDSCSLVPEALRERVVAEYQRRN